LPCGSPIPSISTEGKRIKPDVTVAYSCSWELKLTFLFLFIGLFPSMFTPLPLKYKPGVSRKENTVFSGVIAVLFYPAAIWAEVMPVTVCVLQLLDMDRTLYCPDFFCLLGRRILS